ncbi:hypothetical protein, partial [Burkholderia cepacia]|uniref:hypothetical protein n=1 Tax=Burkholderia cepacia TaxID=292 RepID=UPI00195532C6
NTISTTKSSRPVSGIGSPWRSITSGNRRERVPVAGYQRSQVRCMRHEHRGAGVVSSNSRFDRLARFVVPR